MSLLLAWEDLAEQSLACEVGGSVHTKLVTLTSRDEIAGLSSQELTRWLADMCAGGTGEQAKLLGDVLGELRGRGVSVKVYIEGLMEAWGSRSRSVAVEVLTYGTDLALIVGLVKGYTLAGPAGWNHIISELSDSEWEILLAELVRRVEERGEAFWSKELSLVLLGGGVDFEDVITERIAEDRLGRIFDEVGGACWAGVTFDNRDSLENWVHEGRGLAREWFLSRAGEKGMDVEMAAALLSEQSSARGGDVLSCVKSLCVA